MRPPYLRGLAAPVWAQAASFGAVVVAGLVLGHGLAPHKVLSHSLAPHKALHQEGTSLTISVAGQPNASAGRTAASQFQRAPVAVLSASSFKPAAAGQLGPDGVLAVRVPTGAYAVCVLPPREWRPARATAAGPDGWACTEVAIGTRAAVAELTFTSAARKSGGGRK
jgi:hypothetical protein